MAATAKLTVDCPACQKPIELTITITASEVADGRETYTWAAGYEKPLANHIEQAHRAT